MAHFAELDENNKVLRICVVDNAYVPSDMHVDGETLTIALSEKLMQLLVQHMMRREMLLLNHDLLDMMIRYFILGF